jgi:tetratricopeptide (TPR) repeat protein
MTTVRSKRQGEPASWWRRDGAIGWALAAGVVAVYAQALGFDFVEWDDPAYVTGNPAVRAGLTRAGVTWAFTTSHAANWHPLTWLSHMLDWTLFGSWAGGHHLTSVLLHALNTVLVFRLWRTATGAVGPSAVVAGMFGLHPLHVESVAWVSERKDVLSACGTLLALQAYVVYAHTGGRRPYARALLWLVAALLAKPMAVTVPGLLLLLDVWPLQRLASGARRLVVEKLPFVAIAALASAVTLGVQRRGGAVAATNALDLGARLGNALVAYVAYLGNAAWPTGLSFFYPYPDHLPAWQPLGAAALLVTITAAAAMVVGRRPYVLVGWIWYLWMLLPVIGVVQVGDQARADRYTYLPLVGIFVIVAWGGAELGRRWRVGPGALAATAGAALLACGAATIVQARTWRTSAALFEHALAVDPRNPVAHNLLGFIDYGTGRFDAAAAHFAAAVAARPTMHEAHSNLGLALAVQGRPAEAIPHYQAALRLRPDYATAEFNLAIAFAETGQTAAAQASAARALALAERSGDTDLAARIRRWRDAQPTPLSGAR